MRSLFHPEFVYDFLLLFTHGAQLLPCFNKVRVLHNRPIVGPDEISHCQSGFALVFSIIVVKGKDNVNRNVAVTCIPIQLKALATAIRYVKEMMIS